MCRRARADHRRRGSSLHTSRSRVRRSGISFRSLGGGHLCRPLCLSRVFRDRGAATTDGWGGRIRHIQFLRRPAVPAAGRGMTLTDVLGRVESGTDKALETLKEYCRFPTISERKPTLLMYQHYDVQPVDPLNEWKRDPFDAAIEDGKFWGRGCADTKGNLMIQILAVQAWRAVEGRPPINLKFVVEGEEEVGSPHFASFVHANKEMLRADGATIEGGDHLHEGTPKIELGCKGILYVEMKSRTAKVDQHSSYAAIAPNPAWRLIQALTTLRDPNGRIKVRGWYEDARRPTARELRYLKASRFEAQALKDFWGVSEFVGDGGNFDVLRRLIYSPTCTICGFVSGYIEEGTKTVNPAVAKAKIDFRLVPNMKQE